MNIKSFLLAICGVFLTSCVNQLDSDFESVEVGDIPITFKTKISPINTRVIDNTFEAGDQVGLYATITGISLTEERYIDNLSLLYNNVNSLIPSQEVFYPEGDYNLDFYAYYPYQSLRMLDGKTTMPIQVEKNQESDLNFSKSDFLVAQKRDVVNGHTDVELTFKHKLSKLSIHIDFSDESSAVNAFKSNPTILATDFYTQIVYDFANDNFLQPSNIANLTPHGEWTLNGTTILGKELFVIPQSIEEQRFVLDIAGKIYICALDVENLSKGYKYSLKINAEDLIEGALNRISATISDWEIGDNQESETNNELTNIFIESLSFSTSNIYRIHCDGMPIAEVCKEYLYKENIVDSRAIVVYPMENGVTNLKQGLVLQLLDYTGNIHGGSVSWDKKTNELTYIAGNSLPILSLYIGSNLEITPIVPNEPKKINITSYVLRDMRDGTLQKYPLVKIATQYWMREDLHASHYSDGNSIKAITALDGTPGYAKNADASHCYYTGEAVKTGLLAPDGWKIPNETDWELLKEYLGNNTDALKSGFWKEISGQEYYPGNSKSGFEMLASGLYIEIAGETQLKNIGSYTAYWIAGDQQNQLQEDDMAYQFSSKDMNFKTVSAKVVDKDYYHAFSVRCIKE